MDWLEQWFGIAPDNGDGSLELLIVLSLLTAGALFAIWRYRASRRAVTPPAPADAASAPPTA